MPIGRHQLYYMELALVDASFDIAWPVTYHEINSQGYDIWYCAPPPYEHGFLAAVGRDGIDKQRQALRKSFWDSVKTIPWC